VTIVGELILNRAGCVLPGLFPPCVRPLLMFGTLLAALVGARLAWWAWSAPPPEQYTFHEDEHWRRIYVQREEAQRTVAAQQQRLRAQEATRLEQERFRRAAAVSSTFAARFKAHDDAPAPCPGETRAAAPRATWHREPSPFRARRSDHAYSEIDTDMDSDVSDTPTDAVSIVSHGRREGYPMDLDASREGPLSCSLVLLSCYSRVFSSLLVR
jgi:hypothetical protein